MKNSLLRVILILAFALVPCVYMSAQTAPKFIKETLTVSGVCGQCKNRIEKASTRIKGVRMAKYNLIAQELTVFYKKSKTDIQTISNVIANVGHQTALSPANPEAYANLPACCKYLENEIH